MTSVYNLIHSPVRGFSDKMAAGSNVFERQALSRIGYAFSAAVSLGTGVVDLCLGASSAALATCCLFRIQSLNTFAYHELKVSGGTVANIFSDALKAVNPKAICNNQIRLRGISKYIESRNYLDGIFSSIAHMQLNPETSVTKRSFSFKRSFQQMGDALLAVPARIADLAIGVLAAAGAFLTLGMSPWLNLVACRGLNGPRVAADLFKDVVDLTNRNGIKIPALL